MIYQSVVLAAILAVSSAKLYTEHSDHQKYLWEGFKQDFNKEYATIEEDVRRFGNFIQNLKIADERNQAELANGGSAVHGITKLFDLSHEEFRSGYLKSDLSQKSNDAEIVSFSGRNVTESVVDWSGVYTTPVKDQGYCGSCWAFSATEQIESDSMRTLGTSYILSPEQIVQCDRTSAGCNGGWTESAYKYVTKAGGIETEAAYPYTSSSGKTGTCTAQASKNVITVKSYYTLKSESEMASYVQSTGPLSVCIDADNWNSYKNGIMSVCGKNVDHCVQAVGVYPASKNGYWKVRNSWGTSWGESGYIRLAYGANTCDITNDPTYTSVAKA